MQPEPGTEVIETELATYWINKNGILHSIVKPVVFTIENMEANFKRVAEITGNKRVCVVSDLTHALPVEKDARTYAAGVVGNYYKAMALITPSPFTRIIGNAFINLSHPPIPTQAFQNEAKSLQWLKDYLDQ